VATARAAAIQEANDKEAAITAATTVDELMIAVGATPSEAPAPTPSITVTETVTISSSTDTPALSSADIQAL
jgi:hypothetical protein